MRGRSRIEWGVERGPAGLGLELTWTEANGPVVTPPLKLGFGSVMMRAVAGNLSAGHFHVDYLPAGVRAVVRIVLGEQVSI